MAGKNRIVVDYGDYEGLILLGSVDTKSGEEVSFEELKKLKGFNIVKKYDGISDYTTLKNLIGNNAEGYVVRFSNGDKVKIKGEEYIRLHKIMTEISTKSVWECLSQGDDIYKLIEDVPDEFFDKIDEYVEELKSEYLKIEAKALAHFASLQIYTEDRAEFAKYAKLSPLAPVIFKMLDSKDYANTIWRMIKPEYRKL